jgi:hypothetical protein
MEVASMLVERSDDPETRLELRSNFPVASGVTDA